MMLNIFDICLRGNMPIFEFCCQECGSEFELICKRSAVTDALCTRCGSAAIDRKISMGSFQLKGSGWAHDGYGLSSGAVSSSGGNDSGTDGS